MNPKSKMFGFLQSSQWKKKKIIREPFLKSIDGQIALEFVNFKSKGTFL